MGRGGYNGGSTIISPWRSWSFDPDFSVKGSSKKSGKSKRKHPKSPPAKPAVTIAGGTIGKNVLRKHRMARLQGVDRDTVLKGLECPLPKKPSERMAALKQLVATKVLLQTGLVNIGHPAVAAWLKTNGKKTK